MRLGFRFDGVTYEIGAEKHELYGAIAAADVNAMNEDGWLTCLKRCEEHAEKVRVTFLEDQRSADLKAAGCVVDPVTGHLVWPANEEPRFIRTHEQLSTYSDDDWRKQVEVLKGLVQMREQERAERERRLAEEAERQRDEVARLKAEKQQERHERLMDIGVQQAPEGFYFVPMGDSLTDRWWECVANLADLSAEDWATARTTAMRAVTDAKAAAEAAANRPAPEPSKEEPEAPDVAEHIPSQFVAEAEEEPAAAPEPWRSDADKVAAVVVSIEGARDEVRALGSVVKGDNARKVMEELDAVLTSALRIAREFTTQYAAR